MKKHIAIGSCIAVLGFGSIAHAVGFMQLDQAYPAIACWGDGIARNGTLAINQSGSSRWLICPVSTESQDANTVPFFFTMSINTSPNVACFVNFGDAQGNGWSRPATVRHFSGFDENDWNGTDTNFGGRNISIQCLLPNNKWASQYSQNRQWNDYFR